MGLLADLEAADLSPEEEGLDSAAGLVSRLSPDSPPADVPSPEVPSPEVPSPEVPSPEVPSPEVPSPEVPVSSSRRLLSKDELRLSDE